jgi:putative nucleotidyltransferase with HDIG domain
MNTLRLISQTLKKWQNHHPDLKSFPQSTPKQDKNDAQDQHRPAWFKFVCQVHPPLMFLLTVSTLTGVVSYRFYNQPELAVGTISPVKIIAPRDGEFVDQKTTEELRKKNRTGLIPVLKQDENTTQIIQIKLLKQLTQIEELRKIKGDFPYVPTYILSTNIQKYLQQIDTEKWQQIVSLVKTNQNNSVADLPQDQLGQKAISELNKYQSKVNLAKFNQIIEQTQQARFRYQYALQELNDTDIASLTEPEKQILLTLDHNNWQKFKQENLTALNRILTQGISQGLPDKMKLKTAKVNLEAFLPSPLQNIAVKLVANNLESNLVIDEQQTKARAEKAERNIELVMVPVKKGEVIVDVGEQITQADFVLLDNFGLSRRSINWTGIAGSAGLVTLSVIALMVIAKEVRKKIRRRDQILLWLLSLSVPVIGVIDIGYNSLPAVGFLVSSFYGPTIALTNVTLLTGLTLFETSMIGWEYLLSSYAGSVLAALIASRLHSREELALLGGGVGLTQGSVYFLLNLIISATAGTIWYAILPSALWEGTVGLTYAILALGISPYLERFFDLITPIRLAELSNTNRPLLKRLATETPGTFQHTMFVASLAEAAARKLNCNVELVRAGTLYHDIGKMHDPLGFIENQMGGPNKHDKINNPWQSAKIIKKHVSEGIAMAKKCSLPQAIRDFIPQHQGTLLISYFYFQAKNQAESQGKEIDDRHFRYDGPIPQSRETGIVMLADGCEAALRSLKDATPDQAMAMINKIFKARWRDNQLIDSGIKYEELPIIAEVFVQVWQQFNHQRIAYPQGALEIELKPQPLITT